MFVVVSGFVTAGPVFAQDPLQYTLLEPIGNLQEASTSGDLSQLVGAVFRILFSLIALWSVGLFVAGGIMYMTTEVASTFNTAKDMLWSALYALLILAGSYLLLNTLNPNLLKFQLNTPNATTVTTNPDNLSSNQPTNGSATEPCLPNASPNTVTSGIRYYSSASACGIAMTAATQDLELLNTKSGQAILIINKMPNARENVIAMHKDIINTFNTDCGTVGGSIVKVNADSRDAFLCTKP